MPQPAYRTGNVTQSQQLVVPPQNLCFQLPFGSDVSPHLHHRLDVTLTVPERVGGNLYVPNIPIGDFTGAPSRLGMNNRYRSAVL